MWSIHIYQFTRPCGADCIVHMWWALSNIISKHYTKKSINSSILEYLVNSGHSKSSGASFRIIHTVTRIDSWRMQIKKTYVQQRLSLSTSSNINQPLLKLLIILVLISIKWIIIFILAIFTSRLLHNFLSVSDFRKQFITRCHFRLFYHPTSCHLTTYYYF